MTTINISGQQYQVISTKQFAHNGQQRTELKLRKPNGRRFYFAVVYEDGSISEVA